MIPIRYQKALSVIAQRFSVSVIKCLVVIPYELSGRIGISVLFDLLTEIRQTAFDIIDLMNDEGIYISAGVSELIVVLK